MLRLASTIAALVVVALLIGRFVGPGVIRAGEVVTPKTTLDRSYQCTPQGYRRLRVVDLSAWPNGRGNPPYPPAGAQLSTGTPATQTSLYFFDLVHQNPTLDGSRCRRLTKALAFSRKGLASRGTWVAPEAPAVQLQCGARRWAKVDLRVRIQLEGRVPRTARIELQARLRKGSKRIAYVVWSPRKVTAFAAGACGG